MKKPRYPLRRSPRLRPSFLVLAGLLLAALLLPRLFPSGAARPDNTPAVLAEYPAGPLPPDLIFDKLLLEKSLRRLTAFHGDKAVRIYTVALGFAPVGHKQFQGDGKTPEGRYAINDKNPRSAYYRNLGISYPNNADSAFARKNGKSPGGDIKIHGLAPAYAAIGASHRLTDWTYGCIAVTNPEIEELFNRTPIGTPIEIVP
ncbi:MAG: L,D-transpeptidase family protein [Desulfovibrio sp.]|jgi:hypothetical protein|nr:L,D-transpeptidase family protein [Desulfovibrio sp.]